MPEVLLPHVMPFRNAIAAANLDGELLSDLVWAFGKLDFHVSSQAELCREIFSCFLAHPNHTSFTFSRGIYGANRMGISFASSYKVNGGVDLEDTKWKRTLHPHSNNQASEKNSTMIRQMICHLDRVLLEIDDKGFSIIVYSLGAMGFPASALPVKTRSLILRKLGVILPNLDARGVSNTLYGLGLMGVEYSSIPTSVQDTFQEKLVRTLSRLQKNTGSKSSISPSKDFPVADQRKRDHKSSLTASVSTSSLTPQGYANIVYALGLMRTPMYQLQVTLQSHILEAQCVYIEHMGEMGVGASMLGLAGMAVRWVDWEEGQLRRLEAGLATKVGKLNARGLSNVCFALGKLGADWTSLSPVLRNALLGSLTRTMGQMSPQGLAMCLYGVAMTCPNSMDRIEVGDDAGAQAADDSAVVSDAAKAQWTEEVGKCILRKINQMDCWDLTNTLFALSRLSYPMQPGSPLYVSLLDSLHTLLPRLLPAQLSICTYALGRLRIRHKEMPSGLVEDLQRHFIRCLPRMTEQGVSNSIYAFYIMRLSYPMLLPPLQQALHRYLHKHIYHPPSSVGVKERFKEDIEDPSPLPPEKITSLLHAMALLGVPWQAPITVSPTASTRSSVLGSKVTASSSPLQALNEKGIAGTLYALALMDASWSGLTLPTQLSLCCALNRSCQAMTAQEVANTMYSLAVLSFDSNYSYSYQHLSPSSNPPSPAEKAQFDSTMLLYYAHSKVMEAFKTHLQLSKYYGNSTASQPLSPNSTPNTYLNMSISSEPINLSQFAIYFNTMYAHEHTTQLVREILGDHIPTIRIQACNTPSALHTSIYQELSTVLNDGRYVMVNEFQGLGGIFPIDIAVCVKGPAGGSDADGCELNPLAFIEVDGPTHYTFTPRKPYISLHRVDLLKEHLYAQRYPGVPLYRVTGGSVRKQGVKKVVQDLVGRLNDLSS
eukprot:gene27911-33707_t